MACLPLACKACGHCGPVEIVLGESDDSAYASCPSCGAFGRFDTRVETFEALRAAGSVTVAEKCAEYLAHGAAK